MPVRVKGDPIVYHIQRLNRVDEWETVSETNTRRIAIEEAKRLSEYFKRQFRVITQLVQYETEIPE